MTVSLISPELLETAVSQSFNAIVITNADGQGNGPHIVFCNEAFCQLTGYQLDELLGQSPRILQGPQTDPAVIEHLRDCLQAGRFFRGQTVNYRKGGQPYHVEWNISPVRGEEGQIEYYVSVQQDVSARVEAEQQRDMLTRAIHEMAAPVMIADEQARTLFVNHAFEAQTGYVLEELQHKTAALLNIGESPEATQAALRQGLGDGEVLRRTVLLHRKNGDPYFSDQSLSALMDSHGEIQYFVSIGRDVSKQVKTQNALKTLAHKDALTGVFNRRYGQVLLADCQGQAQDNDDVGTLLLCDIDFFKAINDQYGHAAGDEALKLVVQKMASLLRGSDALVRWGGDEFLLLLAGTPAHLAVMLAHSLCRTVAEADVAEVGGLTLSIGLAVWEQGESSSSVLERADRALYKAKRHGRNRTQIAEGRPFSEC